MKVCLHVDLSMILYVPVCIHLLYSSVDFFNHCTAL